MHGPKFDGRTKASKQRTRTVLFPDVLLALDMPARSPLSFLSESWAASYAAEGSLESVGELFFFVCSTRYAGHPPITGPCLSGVAVNAILRSVPVPARYSEIAFFQS